MSFSTRALGRGRGGVRVPVSAIRASSYHSCKYLALAPAAFCGYICPHFSNSSLFCTTVVNLLSARMFTSCSLVRKRFRVSCNNFDILRLQGSQLHVGARSYSVFLTTITFIHSCFLMLYLCLSLSFTTLFSCFRFLFSFLAAPQSLALAVSRFPLLTGDLARRVPIRDPINLLLRRFLVLFLVLPLCVFCCLHVAEVLPGRFDHYLIEAV